jgi:hypothetical protein
VALDPGVGNRPQLDITKGWLTYDAGTKRVTFHIKVSDLEDDPTTGASPGTTGEQFEFGFGLGGGSYFAVASRDTGTGEDFHVEKPLRTTSKATGITGKFDGKADEITISIPADAFDKSKEGPVITKDTPLDGLTITARANIGSLIVPNVDAAAGLCAFRLGAAVQQIGGKVIPVKKTTKGSASGSSVKPTTAGSLAATGLPVALPALGGALIAGVLVARRRRQPR